MIDALRNEVAHLKREVHGSKDSRDLDRALIQTLRNDLKNAQLELTTARSLHAIKFKAHVPGQGLTTTVFSQGIGKCGLEVKGLKWSEKSDRYVLTQYHTDGTHKTFEYSKEDIVGRVERHYA